MVTLTPCIWTGRCAKNPHLCVNVQWEATALSIPECCGSHTGRALRGPGQYAHGMLPRDHIFYWDVGLLCQDSPQHPHG